MKLGPKKENRAEQSPRGDAVAQQGLEPGLQPSSLFQDPSAVTGYGEWTLPSEGLGQLHMDCKPMDTTAV